MTDRVLPKYVRYVTTAGRNPSYRYDPPKAAVAAGVVKAWSAKTLAETVERAEVDNNLVAEWYLHKDILKNMSGDARVEHLIGDYITSMAFKSLAESTRLVYLVRIDAIKSERIGGLPLNKHKLVNITAPLCQRLYDELVSRGRGITVLNDAIGIYRLLFNFAIRRGYLQHNPFTYVKCMPVKQRRVVWEREHVRAFLNVAFSSFEWRNIGVLVYCAYEWGQRPGDMLQLKWDMYDVEKGVMTITQSKRGETVTLPTSEGLRKVLKQQHNDFSFQPYIAPYPKRKSAKPLAPYSQSNFYNACCRIMEIANLPEQLCIKDLRRTAITEMVEMGVPISSIMAVSGHATVESLNPYMKKTLRSATTAQTMRGINDFTL